METIIPAGYRLTVLSWENDSDNHQTVVVEGLTRKRLEYLLDLCRMTAFRYFWSDERKAKWAHIPDLSNMYEPDEAELKAYSKFARELCEKHNPEQENGDDPVTSEDDAYNYVVEDLYDLGLSCGEWFTRVCESYKVEFVEAPITIPDITEEFE